MHSVNSPDETTLRPTPTPGVTDEFHTPNADNTITNHAASRTFNAAHGRIPFSLRVDVDNVVQLALFHGAASSARNACFLPNSARSLVLDVRDGHGELGLRAQGGQRRGVHHDRDGALRIRHRHDLDLW